MHTTCSMKTYDLTIYFLYDDKKFTYFEEIDNYQTSLMNHNKDILTNHDIF